MDITFFEDLWQPLCLTSESTLTGCWAILPKYLRSRVQVAYPFIIIIVQWQNLMDVHISLNSLEPIKCLVDYLNMIYNSYGYK